MKKQLLFLLSLVPLLGIGQTTLSPGDVVILEFNGNGIDGFTFMPLVDLQEGTTINFTDYGWTGTAFNTAEDGNTSGGGNMITYTAPSAITAGTLIRQNTANIGGSAFTQTAGWSYNFNSLNYIYSINTGSTVNNSNDGLLVFQGTPSSPSFIWGYHTGQWGHGSYLQNFWSELPSTLTNGTNAIYFPDIASADVTVDDGYYSGVITAATATAWRSRVANSANWTTSSGTAPALLYPNTYTVISTSVAPTATSSTATTITESGATLNGSVNANNANTVVTFEYGLTTSYGTNVTADQNPVTGASSTAVSKTITGLASNTTYHFRVVGVNAGGTTNSTDQSFTTTIGTGLDNASSTALSFYPNPSLDGFTIQAKEKATTVSVYNLNGNLVLSQQITGKTYINISSLQQGVYMVKVDGLVGKLVKK